MLQYKIVLSNDENQTHTIFTDKITWKSDEVFRVNSLAIFGFIVERDRYTNKKIYFAINGKRLKDISWNIGYTHITVYENNNTGDVTDVLYSYNAGYDLTHKRYVIKLWANERHQCSRCGMVVHGPDNNSKCVCYNKNMGEHLWYLLINNNKFRKIREIDEPTGADAVWNEGLNNAKPCNAHRDIHTMDNTTVYGTIYTDGADPSAEKSKEIDTKMEELKHKLNSIQKKKKQIRDYDRKQALDWKTKFDELIEMGMKIKKEIKFFVGLRRFKITGKTIRWLYFDEFMDWFNYMSDKKILKIAPRVYKKLIKILTKYAKKYYKETDVRVKEYCDHCGSKIDD